MWEYKKIVFIYKTSPELTEELNKIGSDNWEIVEYKEEKPNNSYSTGTTVTILAKRKKDVPKPEILD
jgi:hypothetical protein